MRSFEMPVIIERILFGKFSLFEGFWSASDLISVLAFRVWSHLFYIFHGPEPSLLHLCLFCVLHLGQCSNKSGRHCSNRLCLVARQHVNGLVSFVARVLCCGFLLSRFLPWLMFLSQHCLPQGDRAAFCWCFFNLERDLPSSFTQNMQV